MMRPQGMGTPPDGFGEHKGASALFSRAGEAYPAAGKAAMVIAILWIATIFSQLDRQLPALLVKPIKHGLNLSDTQFSLIQGYAFAVVYTVMGIPFGRLVDRTNRRNLIIFGLAMWSLMTVVSAMAESFLELAIARMGVGVGEAVLAPAAYSIIADYVAPERRGKALAVYYVSLAIGSGASLLIGGLMMSEIPAHGIALPFVGHIEAWQAAFLFAGLPGLPLIFLLFAIREPVRRETAGAQSGTFGEFLTYVYRNGATFFRVIAVATLLTILGYGMLAWAPAYFDRTFGMGVGTAGPILGVLVAVAGLVGTLFSGWLSDRWLARGIVGARFRVTLLATAILAPAASLWPLMPTPWLGLGVLGLSIFGTSMAQAAAPPSLQDITPNAMRGQAIALYLLIAGLLGIGFGPTSVALVTDYVFKDEQALRWALVTVATPAALLALWASWSGQAHYTRTRIQHLATQKTAPAGMP